MFKYADLNKKRKNNYLVLRMYDITKDVPFRRNVSIRQKTAFTEERVQQQWYAAIENKSELKVQRFL